MTCCRFHIFFFLLLLCHLAVEGQPANTAHIYTGNPESPWQPDMEKTERPLSAEEENQIRARHAEALDLMDQRKFDQAEVIYLELLQKLYTRPAYRESLIPIYGNLATISLSKNSLSKAMEYYLNAVTLVEHTPDSVFKLYKKEEHLGMLAINVGILMGRLQEHEKALLYFDRAERIFRKLGQDTLLTVALINMSGTLNDLNRREQALATLNEAIRITRKAGLKDHEAVALLNSAQFYAEQGDNHTALKYLNDAAKLRPYMDAEKRSQFMLLQGTVHLGLKDYAGAEDYLKKSIRIAQEAKVTTFEHDAQKNLTTLYAETGNYQKAWEHQHEYIRLHDSLFNAERATATQELEARYHILQRDKDIAESRLRLSAQERGIARRNIWIGGIAGGLLLMSLLFFSSRRAFRSKQRLLRAEIENSRQREALLQSQNELEKFKSMMLGEEKERSRLARELHDGIVGQLSAVKMNLDAAIKRNRGDVENKSELNTVLKQLDNATEELRRASHNLLPEILLQRGLEIAVGDFCKKMQQSYGVQIDFYLYGSLPRMDTDKELAIYRMVQGLVQNALKHAGADAIVVQFSCEEALIGITVEDNGRGFDKDQADHGGVGLRHLGTIVKALDGKMAIDSTPGKGTSVYIEMK